MPESDTFLAHLDVLCELMISSKVVMLGDIFVFDVLTIRTCKLIKYDIDSSLKWIHILEKSPSLPRLHIYHVTQVYKLPSRMSTAPQNNRFPRNSLIEKRIHLFSS